MDKPPTSGDKEGCVSSPVVDTTRQKQKSKTAESPDMPATKIRKIANEQNRQIQSAPNSQTIESLTNDNPPASVLSQTNKSQDVSLPTNISTKIKERRDSIKRAQMKQEKLRRKMKTLEENTEAMKKHIQKEVGVLEEIDERLNISGNFQTAVQERQADVENVFAGFRQRQIRINEKYDNVVLNHQSVEDLMEQTEAENSKMKVNADRLEPRKNEVSLVVAETEQLVTELLKLTVIGNGVEKEQKQRDVILCRNQQRHSEGIKKTDDARRNVQVEMDIVREENIKLVSALDDNSGRKLQLLSKCEALRVSTMESRELIQSLNSRIQEFEEREAGMITKIEESKSTSLAIISKRDVELADCRKQMEEHKASYAEKSKKISDTKSSNEKLADSINKSVNDIEKLEKISEGKECQLEKLKEEVTDASNSNKALSAETGNLKKTLADVKEVIVQEKADFETFPTEDQSNKFEVEMRAKLADLRRQCKDKEDLISKTHPEMEAETVEFHKKEAELDEDIVKLDTELPELQKSKENYERDVKKLDSELKKKSNESTQASTQCLRARHEKRVNDQTKRIETLRKEITVIKAEYELENKRMTEPIDKRKAELKEFKSDTVDLEKKISAAQKKRDDLKNRLKKARIPLEAVSDAVPKSARLSPLVGIISTRNKTPPAISTPEHSPEQARLGLWDKFGFGSLSDESSINSSSLFDDAQRQYVKFHEANKTDAAKLSQTKLPKKD